MFLEKWSYQWTKKSLQIFAQSIIMVIFGEKEIEKEKFYAAKTSIKIGDVNVDNIVISKLVKIISFDNA